MSSVQLFRPTRAGVLFSVLVAILAFGSCSDDQPDVLTPDQTINGKRPRLVGGPYIDILPDSCPNPLNPKSTGMLPVAVLGESDFDVTTIDIASLSLNGVAPVSSSIMDVATPPVDMVFCPCADDGPDGYDDLVLLFEAEAVIDAIWPVSVGKEEPLTLTGEYGIETPFEASDCLLIGGEYVSMPNTPTGDWLTKIDRAINVFGAGATTSLGHPVEYRFDLDADGTHRYSEWGGQIQSVMWDTPGTYTVRAEARCALHNVFVSLPSQDGLTVRVNEGPDTEIFGVLNTYFVDGQQFQDSVDIWDAIPDTVPDGSWINVFFNGTRPESDTTICVDFLNKCLTYQNNFTSSSSIVPFTYTTQWLPIPPSDDNPFGTPDTTSMNMGSLEYIVRARATDEFGFVDFTPPEVMISGNLSPTIDRYHIENFDGTVAGDGDSIVWDWLKPENLDPLFPSVTDTVDFTALPFPEVVKRWSFVIAATGHDHPKEPTGSGVKSWFYLFRRADDPSIIEPFARTGFWVEGSMVNILDDVFTFEVRYTLPVFDPNASIDAWRNLPDWLNRGYDYEVKGRDSAIGDTFSQFMWLNGSKVKLNEFASSSLGRQTMLGQTRFYLTIHP